MAHLLEEIPNGEGCLSIMKQTTCLGFSGAGHHVLDSTTFSQNMTIGDDCADQRGIRAEEIMSRQATAGLGENEIGCITFDM